MTGKLNKHKCKKQLIFFVENALVAKETSVLKKNDTFAAAPSLLYLQKCNGKRRSRATAAAYCKTVGLNSD